MQLQAFIILTVAASANAGPLALPAYAPEQRFTCDKINAVLGILKGLGPPAKSFCRSYLHIPATITKTSTAPAPIATLTSTTTTTTIQPGGCSAVAPRDGPAVALKSSRDVLLKRMHIPALSIFAASQLSSGCSCLSLTPKTTVNNIITPPPTATVTTTTTTTVCSTCAPNLSPCDFNHPELCCGRACAAPGILGNTNGFPACVSF